MTRIEKPLQHGPNKEESIDFSPSEARRAQAAQTPKPKPNQWLEKHAQKHAFRKFYR